MEEKFENINQWWRSWSSMIDNDNEQVVDFVCGAIIPKEIYEKAKAKKK